MKIPYKKEMVLSVTIAVRIKHPTVQIKNRLRRRSRPVNAKVRGKIKLIALKATFRAEENPYNEAEDKRLSQTIIPTDGMTTTVAIQALEEVGGPPEVLEVPTSLVVESSTETVTVL
jgi:hypothetical protein